MALIEENRKVAEDERPEPARTEAEARHIRDERKPDTERRQEEKKNERKPPLRERARSALSRCGGIPHCRRRHRGHPCECRRRPCLVADRPAIRIETTRQMTAYFTAHGEPAVRASQMAIGWLGQIIAQQASLLAYIDVFWLAAAFTAVMRAVALGAASAVH